MSEVTRRGFVKNSAGAAAGVTVVGALLTSEAADAAGAEPDASSGATKPVVAYVKDPRKGEISVMAGDREITVHDRKLARQIVRASR